MVDSSPSSLGAFNILMVLVIGSNLTLFVIFTHQKVFNFFVITWLWN